MLFFERFFCFWICYLNVSTYADETQISNFNKLDKTDEAFILQCNGLSFLITSAIYHTYTTFKQFTKSIWPITK